MTICNRVKIISDSTCDLSAELIAKYNIDILPLHILLGENEYEDGKNIAPDQIYAWSDEHKTTPKTSAPSLETAIELFRPYVKERREVICFSISSSMSTSGNVMRLAAEELEASDLITVVDSASLSTGIGLLVIEAAIMAENHCSAKEIVKTKGPGKFRCGYSYLSVPGRPLQCRCCHGRKRFQTASQNCGRKWSHERRQKVPWKNRRCHHGLCERYGRRFKRRTARPCIYYPFRL